MIITNVLNFGDTEDVVWLFKTYDTAEIIDVVQNPSRGSWSREALHYWQLILDVQVERGKAERALMDAAPRPEVYAPMFD